jgi:hypothetical protein
VNSHPGDTFMERQKILQKGAGHFGIQRIANDNRACR